MRRRALLIVLAALVLGLVAAGGGAAWVLRTEAGAAWVAARAVAATDGALSLNRVEGTLSGGLRVERLAWRGDGWSVTAEGVRFEAHPGLWPPGVRIDGLRVAGVTYESGEATAPPGDQVGLAPLPVLVDISNAEVGPLDVDGERAWRRAAGSVRLGDALVLENVTADTPLGPASLNATLGFQAPWTIDFDAAARLETNPEAEPVALRARGTGDAERLELEAETADSEITVTGTIEGALTAPRARLEANVPRLSWPPRDAAPSVQATAVRAGVEGWLDRFEWNLETTLDAWGFERAAVHARGTNLPTGLEASELTLRDANHDFAGTGRLDWGENPGISVDLVATDLAPGAWLEGWRGERVSGAAALRWDGDGLVIERAVLEGRRTGLRLALEGGWDAASGRIGFNADWRSVYWPADGEAAALTSEAGTGRIDGTLDAWTAVAQGRLAVRGYPGGRVDVEAEGDREGAKFRRLELNAMGGRARGDGRVAWGEDGAWAAALALEGVDAGALYPALTGPLSGDVALAGDWRSGAFSARTRGLRGGFRGREVYVEGELALDEAGAWRFDTLRALSGDSMVRLDGEPWGSGVTVRATAVAVEDWTDLASGTIDADFRAGLAAASPFVDGELLVRSPGAGDLAAERLALTGVWRPGDGGSANLDLNVTGLRQGDNVFGQLRGRYAGQGAARELSMEVASDTAAFRLRGTGAFERGAGGEWRWRGKLQQTSLETSWPEFAGFDLEAPVGILAGARIFELDEACFAADEDGRICVAGSGMPAGRLAATADFDRWPMDSVSSILALDVRPSQSLTGHATLTLDDLRLVASVGALDISAGRVRRTDVGGRPLRTEEGRLAWSTAPDRALEIDLDLPVVDAGTVRGELRLAPPLGTGSGLSGALNLALESLAPLAGPFPLIDEVGGRLDAQLDLSGTLGEPSLAGAIDLSGGLIEYQPLGLRVTDIELGGRFAAGEPAELSGRFRSGEGTGRIEARLAPGEGAIPQLVLRFAGQDIQLADLPEARIVGTPDLRLTVRGERMDLGGSLLIPYARLAPRDDPSGFVAESEDVVILGEEPDDEAPAPTGPVKLTGEVRVALGDDVRMSLAGADTRIDGEVTLRWDASNVVPKADGKFNVEGKYRAYGQLLEITEGAVAFPGVPADDPSLDIRAERQVFGSREVDAAGVWITGTAQRPDLVLYTQPPTSDERALSFLVTGSDFDYADGVGQLTVGTYVLPRLFVSYGRGLFEDINVISGRFDISQHWGIKGSSSERESGVDLTYTIDK